MSTKKIKVAILGSTGSIGKITLDIIYKKKNLFDIKLLVCNNNYRAIVDQINKFSPKYVYVKSEIVRQKLKLKTFKNTIIVDDINTFLKKYNKSLKLDKAILGISSYNGLSYAFNFLKVTKELLIANKESIICGGDVLLKKAKQHNCKISSIDSEHYCIAQTILNEDKKKIDTIYITASGGPFLNKPRNSYRKSSIKNVIKHPKWNMGQKISVDSATLVNKIFEMIEAHILFKIPSSQIKIKIHPESLIHSSVVYKNGLVKMIMHNTSMEIPIRNSLLSKNLYSQKRNFFNIKKNFSLNLSEHELSQFKILKTGKNVIKLGHTAWILFNVINDLLVTNFLNKKIYFYEIVDNLIKFFKKKHTLSFCKFKIKNYNDINFVINHAVSEFNKL